MNKDELMHYGILGMKWGHHKAKAPNSEDYTRYRELRKKKVSQLSTRELNELNSRMQAEDNYKRNRNNRDPLNKAYKMAVGVGLAITALETTHKALQRVKKNTKPVMSNIYDRIKNLKHSDMDDDYLMHYGVLGMKWKNHVLKRQTQNEIKKKAKEKKVKELYYRNGWDKSKTKDALNQQLRSKNARTIKTAVGSIGGLYAASKWLSSLDGKNIKINTKKGQYNFNIDPRASKKVFGVGTAIIGGTAAAKLGYNTIRKINNDGIANKVYNEHVDKLVKGKYKPSTRSKNKDIYKGMYD